MLLDWSSEPRLLEAAEEEERRQSGDWRRGESEAGQSAMWYRRMPSASLVLSTLRPIFLVDAAADEAPDAVVPASRWPWRSRPTSRRPCGAAAPARWPSCCPRAPWARRPSVLAALVALAFFGAPVAVSVAAAVSGAAGGVQFLDGLPDPGHGALAVRELLDRLQVGAESGDAGEAVPDLDQAVGGPVGGELGKFLLAGELLLAFGDLLGGREGCDGVVVVDGK